MPSPDPLARSQRVAEAMRLAAVLMAEKDPRGAVSVLHEVLALATTDEKRRVRLILAQAYLSEPPWRRYGLRLLTEMAGQNPADADALALLGGFYRSQGLLARAESTLHRALAADPRHSEARSQLRAVADHLGRREAPAPSRPRGRGLLARLLSRRR
jgi:Flp pilus assembly protein TadD